MCTCVQACVVVCECSNVRPLARVMVYVYVCLLGRFLMSVFVCVFACTCVHVRVIAVSCVCVYVGVLVCIRLYECMGM